MCASASNVLCGVNTRPRRPSRGRPLTTGLASTRNVKDRLDDLRLGIVTIVSQVPRVAARSDIQIGGETNVAPTNQQVAC